jgi:hypothetical protein
MKRAIIILLSIIAMVVVMLVGLFLYLRYAGGPPKEAVLLQTFYAHRSSFEQLRDMLQADEGLHRLADWGVQTKDGIFKPPAGNFPVDRYNKYLALLKDAHAIGAARGGSAHPEPNVLLWASGFGGDTTHVGICWTEGPPSRQVSSFDSYYRDHKSNGTNGWVYRHIDSNWYLWTDLWTE